jgi:hypothetical protein
VSDLRTCEPPPVKDDKPVQTEETVGLEELLEYISNGYFFENIECYHTLDGFGIPIAWVRIEKTNLRFDYLKA